MTITVELFVALVSLFISIGFWFGMNYERISWCFWFLPVEIIYKRKAGMTMNETMKYYLTHHKEWDDFFPQQDNN